MSGGMCGGGRVNGEKTREREGGECVRERDLGCSMRLGGCHLVATVPQLVHTLGLSVQPPG